MTRVLLVGFFSFEHGKATAGDILARDVLGEWLRNAGIEFDTALSSKERGLTLWNVQPRRYTHVVFVCGPCFRSPLAAALATQFAHAKHVALNVSMIEALDLWNPFHTLFERDSDRMARPDLVFCSTRPQVPVTGVVLVHPQEEYGKRGRHQQVEGLLRNLLVSRPTARVNIDTGLDENAGGLRSASEVESLIARMDLVVTTRLHGMVLALKNGVPVVAVDPIDGGAKVLQQARTIDWPVVFTPQTASERSLSEAYEYCLSADARRAAAAIRHRALERLADLKGQLLEALGTR